jgi:uncharacterized membrane protein
MARGVKPLVRREDTAYPQLLSHVMERNIRTITRLRLDAVRARTLQDRLADAITTFSGSMPFVYLHIVWFSAWILVNTGRLGLPPFDPFPYGLLTMMVSLEAIFLSTFVLISQNRLSDAADLRAEMDLQIGLLAEHEITRVLQMLDAIQDKLGIENDADSELADLEMETRPEDVLAEIDRVHKASNSERPRGDAGRSKRDSGQLPSARGTLPEAAQAVRQWYTICSLPHARVYSPHSYTCSAGTMLTARGENPDGYDSGD